MPKYLDSNGLTHLWSKISMEDYPNNETLVAVLNAIDETKVDKIDGKGLSTNDFTTEEKEKLAGIETGAQVNVQSDWNETDETSFSYIQNKPDEANALELVVEIGLVEPVFSSDGSIYTDENGAIYTLI